MTQARRNQVLLRIHYKVRSEFVPVIFNIIKYGYNESGYSEITLITKALCPWKPCNTTCTILPNP